MTKSRPKSFHTDVLAGRTEIRPPEGAPIDRPEGNDGWILNLTIRGCGQINRGEDAFRAPPGTVLLFPPGVAHIYGPAPRPGHWSHLWVYFFPRPAWYEWLDWPLAPGGILSLTLPAGPERRAFRQRFEALISLSHGPVHRRTAWVMNGVEDLLLRCDMSNPQCQGHGLDDRIRLALDHICQHYDRPLRIPQLAALCALSPSRLAHLFRAQVGASPMQYLEQQRVRRARELLLMTALPVAAVAEEVGYRNPFYFSRIFRRHTGLSPRAFRTQPRTPPDRLH